MDGRRVCLFIAEGAFQLILKELKGCHVIVLKDQIKVSKDYAILNFLRWIKALDIDFIQLFVFSILPDLV